MHFAYLPWKKIYTLKIYEKNLLFKGKCDFTRDKVKLTLPEEFLNENPTPTLSQFLNVWLEILSKCNKLKPEILRYKRK